MSAIFTHNLGFPRIGASRELKIATEKYWQGKITQEELKKTGKELRKKNWELQREKGIDLIPSNDFSFYDQMLDTVALFGAVPERYGHKAGDQVDLDTYFTMARGLQEKDQQKENMYALEMLKWIDTNYHYMVPEFVPSLSFSLSSSKIFDEFSEAKELGIVTKPVLIGPITFLLLGKTKQPFDKLQTLLPKLVPLYVTVLQKLSQLGAKFVQIDEPVLVKDLSASEIEAFRTTYAAIAQGLEKTETKLILATYFDNLNESNLSLALSLPVQVLHVDLTRGSTDVKQLASLVAPTNKILSLGLINGRNIWKNRFSLSLSQIQTALSLLSLDRVWLAPSCSLIHSPITLEKETKLKREILNVMSFANEKLDELVTLSRIALEKEASAALTENNATWTQFLAHPALTNGPLRTRIANLTPSDFTRKSKFAVRSVAQRNSIFGENANIQFPTTTIGSLPQTSEVRAARLKFRKGELTQEQYRSFIDEKTKEGILFQEEVGLDVLVTGEFERNDMVEFFGGELDGFAFTENGWVQSFGSRYVKPPIIWADVLRPHAITVSETAYAATLTKKPVKGMLTGPITLLQWSFPRDDITRSEIATQLGLAMRDEVTDLVSAGIKVVQVDEPAFREGLPIKRERWAEYLDWASKAFRLSTSGVEDAIQIHTHMCYAEFSDIISAIADLDADVISIESSRSQMKLLPVFADFKYTNEIGPGVFDIHSPTIPDVESMVVLMKKAMEVIPANLLWVNPDCGLKTRQWSEVKVQLKNMCDAARKLREEFAK